jgi:hypothetical protein
LKIITLAAGDPKLLSLNRRLNLDFHFFDFLNLIISLSYGIFSLKINIMIWRATRFTSAKAGIMGRGMGQYPIAPGG